MSWLGLAAAAPIALLKTAEATAKPQIPVDCSMTPMAKAAGHQESGHRWEKISGARIWRNYDPTNPKFQKDFILWDDGREEVITINLPASAWQMESQIKSEMDAASCIEGIV